MKHYDLVLVDGSSYLYRAFHALPPLTNSNGEPTGAAYGVINMLRKLQKDTAPAKLVVVFDAKGKTFRDDLYPDYKATRPPIPDDLACQIAPLHQVIKAMGLPLIVIEGVEADDVIGTLAHQATKIGWQTLISTGDKDMAQLVNDQVTIINTMTNKVMDQAGVIEKFNVKAEQIIDYLSLIGDSVDNVPGVPKVGPKTAAKWLKEHGDLDTIMQNAEEFAGKIGENLRASLDHLPLSRQLVTIKLDVDLGFALRDIEATPAENQQLIQLFQQMEFKSWLEELLGNTTDDRQTHYETILTEKDFKRWLEKLSKAKLFAFDTETNSLNPMSADLVGVSFSYQEGTAAYLPLAHDYDDAPKQLSRDTVLAALKPLLEDPKRAKLGHNLKYDMSVLAKYGITLQGIAYDSMLESYVLQSAGTRHDMDSLALKYLGHRTIHYEEVCGKGAKQITFNQVPLEQAAPYAAEDADITLQLHDCFWSKISSNKDLKHTFSTIEMPLLPVLSRIERNGVLIDAALLAQQSRELAEQIKTLQNTAYELAGQEFNLASPKQLQAILYEQQALPVLQKTAKGAPSTAEAVLQELALEYPLPSVILEFRSLSKLKSTYTDSLPQQINPLTGRVHTSYNQAVTATGRLSSTEPNLQNIPVRTQEGRRIRQAFIAPEGYQILAADYSQIELRIMAHLSGDKGLTDAFANGLDIHSATAAEVMGVKLEDVTPEQRRSAKAINFGLIYGMSAFGLAKQLGTDRRTAQAYVDLYFARYPGVKAYMEETRAKAHELGFVQTIYGRRLSLPEIHSKNFQRVRAAERAAINAPMQGTAADIIKMAMIDLDSYLAENDLDARMIMQVHDELVFEVAADAIDKLKQEVDKRMTQVAKLAVPLAVSIGIGASWDEAH